MIRNGWRAFGMSMLLSAVALGQDLQSSLDRARMNSKAADATISWFVTEIDGVPGLDSEALAVRGSSDSLIPASNMKLITSGAALLVLGPAHVYRTEFGMSGDTLVVRGAGDPALADPDLLERMDPPMTVDDVLDVLAGAVFDSGVTSVEAVVIDDRIFAREGVHDSWPKDQLDKQYCAQVSGLNFHTNVLRVFVAPGTGGTGTAAVVTTQPSASWLSVGNRTRTSKTGTNQVWPTRTMGTNTFTVHGQVVRKSYYPLEVTVHEPATFFGALLADRLRARGVSIKGPVRLADAEEDLPFDSVLARITTNIQDVLDRCNQDSRNVYAESLLKILGHQVTGEPGSWANGSSVVRMILGQLVGPDAPAGAVIADGSGMSRDNRVSTELFCRWLEAIAENERLAEPFRESLAVPGVGTFRRRFVTREGSSTLENDIYAKSGYLNGVRSLSGYLVHDSGRTIAFSFILNDIKPTQDAAAKQLINACVAEIDAYLTDSAGVAASHPGG